MPSLVSVPAVSSAAVVPIQPRSRRRALASVPPSGLLRASFRDERDASATFARTPSLLRELLDDAGLEQASEAPNRDHITNADLECALPNGDLAMVELALTLDREHIWKDLIYVTDPRAEPRLAAFVWLCDDVAQSALDALDHFTQRFGVKGRVSFTVLRLKRLNLAAGQARFDRLYSSAVHREVDPPALRVAGGLADQMARAASGGRIDTQALADVLGTSTSWVSGCLPLAKECGRPALDFERTRDGSPLVTSSRRRLFSLDRAMAYVPQVETWVRRRESLAGAIPLVSAKDPRIGTSWLKLTNVATRAGRKLDTTRIRRVLRPVAFCFGPSEHGYSLLYSREDCDRLEQTARARPAPKRKARAS